MIKFFAILGVNLFLLYCFVLFFMDNKILTKEPFAIVRNMLLFAMAIWICYNIVSIYVLQNKNQESGLVYSIASKTKTFGLAVYEYVQPFKKELGIWSLVAAGCIFLGFISLGMPGALLLIIPEKIGLVKEITGDNAWPAAIVMSFTWPFLFPVAVVIKHLLIKTGYVNYSVTGFYGVIGGGIIILIVLIHEIYKTEG